MNNKEEIKQYLDAQLCVSKENPIQIVRDDFEHLLNSAASCTLITVEGVMPDLMEQLRTELKTLRIKTALDMVVNVSYHSSSEISFDQLYDLLSIIREFEPKINIIWGCGIDTRVNKPNFSLILLIGHASEQF